MIHRVSTKLAGSRCFCIRRCIACQDSGSNLRGDGMPVLRGYLSSLCGGGEAAAMGMVCTRIGEGVKAQRGTRGLTEAGGLPSKPCMLVLLLEKSKAGGSLLLLSKCLLKVRRKGEMGESIA